MVGQRCQRGSLSALSWLRVASSLIRRGSGAGCRTRLVVGELAVDQDADDGFAANLAGPLVVGVLALADAQPDVSRRMRAAGLVCLGVSLADADLPPFTPPMSPTGPAG